VPDLARAASLYQSTFGVPVGPFRFMPDQGIAVAFVEMGQTHLELIAPIGDSSPISHVLGTHTIQDFLARQPLGGLHHVCYLVDDLAAAWDRLRQVGMRRLGTGEPIIGAAGLPILFLDPAAADGVLIELKGRFRSAGLSGLA